MKRDIRKKLARILHQYVTGYLAEDRNEQKKFNLFCKRIEKLCDKQRSERT